MSQHGQLLRLKRKSRDGEPLRAHRYRTGGRDSKRVQHIGSLPVTEDERLVGMITDRDITTRVVAESAVPEATSVGDVYSRDLISAEPNKDLEGALQLMARHQVRRLPVVENGRLVGMVVQADIALKRTTGPVSSSARSPSPRRESASSVQKSSQRRGSG
jgi:CBS domain-containing protein